MTYKSVPAWLGLAFFTILCFHNCSQAPIKHQSFPPIGESVVIPLSETITLAKADNSYRHVLIYFTMGSATLDYAPDARVQFLSRDDQSVLAEYSGQQLKDMYQTTGCPDQVSAFLENAFVGDTLFCNNSLDLSQVGEFRIIRGDSKKKTATSYTVEFARNELDMIALTVNAN
jgi:hypothetical protein